MNNLKFTVGQNVAFVLLRLLVGWHFLYEGVIKLYNPSWTSKGYLLSAEFLKPVFTWMASEDMIGIIDSLNISGLIAIGLGLMIGVFVKGAAWGGMILLGFYYLAHPPFGAIPQGPSEGSYWIVNKNLIEIAALFVIYQFPATEAFGAKRFFEKRIKIVTPE